MINRRMFGAGALAFGATLSSTGARAANFCTSTKTDFRVVQNAKFDRWVDGFKLRALKRGISRKTLDAGFKGAGYIPGVVFRDGNQFQVRRTFEDYISIATSDERLKTGRKMVRKHRKLLASLEKTYGVDAYIIAAIWGVESKYGERRGDISVISATATLAFDGRRAKLFENQLMAALRILQNGDVRPRNLMGSWAGAMGHTQFIPTSYQAFAVDFNRDGRRDVWSNDPTDALASTAAYLAKNGWVRGQSWGGEAGVTSVKGKVIRPQAGGPQFIVAKNHRVILRYNNSETYALTVGHLADRLRGQGPLRGAFPKDANGMSLKNRVDLQKALTRKRFKIGDADGVIGRKTQCAIQTYQSRQGLAVNGQPSLDLLRQIKR